MIGSIRLKMGCGTRIRGLIEDLLEVELETALGRRRYERPGGGLSR